MPKFSLVAFAATAKILASKPLPDRLLVAPWGETKTRKGLVVCNARTLAELPGNQVSEKRDRVAFDFNHNTVKENAPEPIRVAGYGIPEVVEGEGLYLSSIEYTEEGADLLAKGHYPDISPAVVRDKKTGEILLLHSVGACRHGEIDGLTLFSASDDLRLSTFMAMGDEDEGEDDGDKVELRAVLIGLINGMNPETPLADDASDGDIATAARAVAAKMKPAEGGAETTAMSARLDAFEAKFEKRERAAMVKQATADGKVIPLSAAEIDRLELTVLESMITKLPVTVPLESRIAGAVDDFRATSGGTITPEAREVARQMGLDPKDLV